MRLLTSFVLGTVAFGALAYAAALVAALALQSGGARADVRLGPVAFLTVEPPAVAGGEASSATLGHGLLLVALVGGAANAAAAAMLRRRD